MASQQLAPHPAYDVFLAYNSTDRPSVEALARRLRVAGLEPFFDAWHLVPGHPWQEGLEEALLKSRACAVFLGTRGLGPWQHEEMRVALEVRVRDAGFRVIPVLLPGAPEPKAPPFPVFLRRLTWIRFASLDDEEAYYRLLCAVRNEEPGAAVTGAATTPEANDAELAHVRDLVEIHRKRQRILEKQAAFRGADVPPHVLMELEEVRNRIHELEAKLRGISGAAAQAH